MVGFMIHVQDQITGSIVVETTSEMGRGACGRNAIAVG